jgi:hypothetical protein
MLLVSAVAAVFVWQAGLVGGEPKAAPPVQAQETPKQPETAKPAPTVQELPPFDDSKKDEPPQEAARNEPATEPPTELSKPSPTVAPAQPARTDSREDAPPARILPIPERKPSPLKSARTDSGRVQDIWVTSNPPGAKAVIDGNLADACRTPCTLHGVTGRHNITVSQAGFQNAYKEVDVGDTAVDVPQITLRQPQGTLFLSTIPSGASIRVNGQLVPQVTNTPLTLTPGTYNITVEKNGVSKTQRVQVGDGVVRLSITFEP